MSQQGAGQNKVVVITGGGSGIGLAMARIFAANSFSVIITGRDPRRLEAAEAKISPDRKQVAGIPCDVRDPGSVEKLFREIGKHHSTIDVLINNAGVAHSLVPVDQLPVDTWKEVIDTNLTLQPCSRLPVCRLTMPRSLALSVSPTLCVKTCANAALGSLHCCQVRRTQRYGANSGPAHRKKK